MPVAYPSMLMSSISVLFALPILCDPQSVGEHLLHQAQSQEPCHLVPGNG